MAYTTKATNSLTQTIVEWLPEGWKRVKLVKESEIHGDRRILDFGSEHTMEYIDDAI